MVGARIPQDWAQSLEAIAQGENITTAEVCRRALGQFLGKRVKARATIESRVRKLERQLAALIVQRLEGD